MRMSASKAVLKVVVAKTALAGLLALIPVGVNGLDEDLKGALRWNPRCSIGATIEAPFPPAPYKILQGVIVEILRDDANVMESFKVRWADAPAVCNTRDTREDCIVPIDESELYVFNGPNEPCQLPDETQNTGSSQQDEEETNEDVLSPAPENKISIANDDDTYIIPVVVVFSIAAAVVLFKLCLTFGRDAATKAGLIEDKRATRALRKNRVPSVIVTEPMQAPSHRALVVRKSLVDMSIPRNSPRDSLGQHQSTIDTILTPTRVSPRESLRGSRELGKDDQTRLRNSIAFAAPTAPIIGHSSRSSSPTLLTPTSLTPARTPSRTPQSGSRAGSRSPVAISPRGTPRSSRAMGDLILTTPLGSARGHNQNSPLATSSRHSSQGSQERGPSRGSLLTADRRASSRGSLLTVDRLLEASRMSYTPKASHSS